MSRMAASQAWKRAISILTISTAFTAGFAASTRIVLLLSLPPGFLDDWVARHPSLGILDVDDVRYLHHAGMTLAHVIPALVFAILAPLQFVASIRSRRPGWHRWAGRTLVTLGTIVGISGLGLGLTTALEYGGASEAAPIAVFAPLFLFSLYKGVTHIRRGQVASHREWMIRAFSIAASAGTVRLTSFFFAVSPAVRHAPSRFIGVVFWTGFVISLCVAELWIQYTRTRESGVCARTAAASL
jgi:uncharacterized membrane protein